jgi:hypothetical protein
MYVVRVVGPELEDNDKVPKSFDVFLPLALTLGNTCPLWQSTQRFSTQAV